MMGMIGQDVVCDSGLVWITATNYPMQLETTQPFNAQKMVCMVRNPLETIAEYANAYVLQGHNLTPHENLNDEFPQFWNDFVLATA